jgi:hypothetical protein
MIDLAGKSAFMAAGHDRLTNGKPALARCIGVVETEFGQM